MATSSGVQVAPFWDSLWRTSWNQQRQWLKSALASIIFITNWNIALLAGCVLKGRWPEQAQTQAEMWRVNFFRYLANWRTLRQPLGSRDTGGAAQALPGSALLMGTGAAVCTHLPHIVPPCWALHVLFVISELWSLSQDSNLRLVHESASKSLWTPLLSQHRYSTSQNRG